MQESNIASDNQSHPTKCRYIKPKSDPSNH
jgi:hypothetical protein